jgi:hemoglobin
MSKNDISSRDDIVKLVDQFYDKVLDDATIGYIFKDVAKIDMKHHMPRMYDFWESTVLNKTTYRGNTMKVHLDINDKESLKKAYFDQWLVLFNATVDELFRGEKAELAKTRALSIATVMQIKLHK